MCFHVLPRFLPGIEETNLPRVTEPLLARIRLVKLRAVGIPAVREERSALVAVDSLPLPLPLSLPGSPGGIPPGQRSPGLAVLAELAGPARDVVAEVGRAETGGDCLGLHRLGLTVSPGHHGTLQAAQQNTGGETLSDHGWRNITVIITSEKILTSSAQINQKQMQI